MLKSTSRSLMLLAGAWLLSTPGISQGGGLFFPHHHGYSTTTYSSSSVAVTPASTIAIPTVVPAATFMQVVPASSYSVVPAASFINVTPAASYVMVPASSLANTASPLSALATTKTVPAANMSSALTASVSQALAASPIEAQAAMSSFPYLAQAAQSQGMHGGLVVVALRNFAKAVVAGFGGQAAVKTAVKTFLTGELTTHLGPLSGPVVSELDKILGEVFGGTPDTSTGSNSTDTGTGGQCFTIRVCIDETGKATGGVVNPGVSSTQTPSTGSSISGNGRVPSLAPLMSSPSGQFSATPQRRSATSQGQSSRRDDEVPPAPQAPSVVPAEAPASSSPPTPSPVTPPTPGTAGNSDPQLREVMAVLTDISERLKKLEQVK